MWRACGRTRAPPGQFAGRVARQYPGPGSRNRLAGEGATTTWAKPAAWLGRHRAELRLGLRITVAGLLAFALAHLLELRQGYWAVLTAVIVVQGNVGGSLKAATDRLIGTLAGGAYGVVVATLVPQGGPFGIGLALAVLLAPLAIVAALRPGLRVAPVTAIIVLLGTAAQNVGLLPATIDRVIEIALGGAIAFAVSLLVLPTRAHAQLAAAAADALDLLGDLVPALLTGLSGHPNPGKTHDLYRRIRGALAKLNGFAEEVRREKASLLTDEPDPEPVLRTIRRLRHDFVMIDRATRDPIDPAIAGPLTPSLGELSAALEAFLRGAASAFRQRRAPPSLEVFHSALTTYHAAMAGIRRQGLTRDLAAEAAARIFGLAFALEQLGRDLDDLASRAQERAGDLAPRAG
jgi:uncharacterized membrane protein YccC